MSKVTVHQIAARAGVSPTTVSNALNARTRSRYAPAARRADRIRALAEEMGYRPNLAARATRTGRHQAIGLVLSTTAERGIVFATMLEAFQAAADERGVHLVLARLPAEELAAGGTLPRLVRETTVDGLLIGKAHGTHHAPGLLNALKIPAVWLNEVQPHDAVRYDEVEAGRRVVEELVQLGHRHIAWAQLFAFPEERGDLAAARRAEAAAHEAYCACGCPAGLRLSGSAALGVSDDNGAAASRPDMNRLRYAGYCDGMRRAGLKPQVLVSQAEVGAPREQHVAVARRTLRACLDGPNRPTAVVAFSRVDAVAFAHAAALERIDVPGELSLATYSAGPCEDLGLRISSMVVSRRAFAGEAMAMLAERIAEPTRQLPARLIGFEWTPGETTGPAPGQGRATGTQTCSSKGAPSRGRRTG